MAYSRNEGYQQGYQQEMQGQYPATESGRGGQAVATRQEAAPAQQKAQMTQKEWELAIREGLSAELTNHAKALPGDFKRERFILNAITVIGDHANDFRNINRNSIVLCIAKGAYLGLDFLNGECYAIPYSGVANFQTDYKGEIKLAKKYSRKKITDIYAKNVRKGDYFEEVITDGHQSVNFKPQPFSDEEIIGTFAVVLYEDGSMIYDTMSVKEIDHTRATYSKAKNSQAWKESAGEMYKKTVLRRLLKLVDLEFDTKEQIEAFSDGSMMEFEGSNRTSRRVMQSSANDSVADIFGGGQVVDVTPEE